MGVGADTTVAETAAADYQQLTHAIRELVQSTLPAGAIVTVISRGDDQLLSLGDRIGWHFPQDPGGQYTGYHPADSTAAIAHLEDVRERGADYLLIPNTALWWLDHYAGLRDHLEANYPLVVNREEVCLVFQLSDRGAVGSASAVPQLRRERVAADFVQQFRDLLMCLLPAGAVVAVVSLGERALTDLSGLDGRDFPGPGLGAGAPIAPHTDALAHLGVQFLVVPRTAFGWLEEEPELAQHLASNHRFITRQEHLCEIYELETGDGRAFTSLSETAAESAASPPDANGLDSITAQPGATPAAAGRGLLRRLFGRPAPSRDGA
jgi:hypothetical protein